MKRKKSWMILVILTGIFVGAQGTTAYQTAFDFRQNKVRVGYNHTEIEEEFPAPSPIPGNRDEEFVKKVQISNRTSQAEGGSVDCYVRVSLGYSNSDIGNAVTLKNLDEVHWKKEQDGFYYYKEILKEGETTAPLFTGFFIEESKIKKEYLEYLKNFEIQVYEESIQASPFKDYQSAWAHYQDWV